MKRLSLSIILQIFFLTICSAQLISTTQYFKEDFEISKYRNDNCVANMLNTISIDACENISNIKFSIFYEIEISDSLRFSFELPKGDVFYSEYDISDFLLPEKINIKCGSLNRIISIEKTKMNYSFERPTTPGIAECTFIFSNEILNNFNSKINTIRTCTALTIVSDSLISILNRFSSEEKYIGSDAGIFLTFIDSQLDYIKKNADSISKISNIIDTQTLYNKIRIIEARRNSVALSYTNENTGRLALGDRYATDLANNFCNYYDKWLYMSNSSKHLYSGEIAYMSSFKRTKPDLDGFLKTISESAQNAFLNYMYLRLLNDATTAYENNNINISLILIDNYEYISEISQNSYTDSFHKLKTDCLSTLRDSYLKLAEMFEQNGNYSISKNYNDQAKAIQNNLMAHGESFKDSPEHIIEHKEVPDTNYVTISTVNTNTIEEDDSNYIVEVEEDEKIEFKEDKEVVIEDIAETTEIIKEEEISHNNCSLYIRKLKVLDEKIDSFTIFTVENLFNRYSNEHPECIKLSFNEWIESIGREDLLSKKKKNKR
ncbi:MAG: hypothetical protein LBP67_06865 [Bacteroidales bacterium]|jgi:hypothetical protein|nr:hypothetical protein [Bacteroidales bacterium]